MDGVQTLREPKSWWAQGSGGLERRKGVSWGWGTHPISELRMGCKLVGIRDQPPTSLRAKGTRGGTYCTDSGDPVRDTLRSGRPPLSGKRAGAQLRVSVAPRQPLHSEGGSKFLVQECPKPGSSTHNNHSPQDNQGCWQHLPGEICTLHPESCWILLICSPPRPMTREKRGKRRAWMEGVGPGLITPPPPMGGGEQGTGHFWDSRRDPTHSVPPCRLGRGTPPSLTFCRGTVGH